MFDKATDTANALVDQSADTAQETVKASQHAATSALKSLQGALHDLRRQATPLLDSVKDSTHQLKAKVAHASDDTVHYIRQKPVKSMLIAAATGAALVALLNLMSSRRSRH